MQCLRQKRVKQWRHQGGYKQRARCVPFGKLFFIMPSISLTSLCSFAQLQENSISHLSSVVLCKEFAVSLYRWGYAQLCMLTHDKSTNLSYDSYLYSRTELELARSKVSTKVCGFTFGPISLHLISKRIKEILTQKHQYVMLSAAWISSDYFESLLLSLTERVITTRRNQMLSENKTNSYIFPDFNCMHRRTMYVRTCTLAFLVGEIADRFLSQALYG